MRLQELVTQLETASDAFTRLAPNDPDRFDLAIAISQIKKEMVLASFDVDADINAITVEDQAKLRDLTAKLSAATDAAAVPHGALATILGIVKMVLPAVGIAIP